MESKINDFYNLKDNVRLGITKSHGGGIMMHVNPNDWRRYLSEEDRRILRGKKRGDKPCPFCGHPVPQLLESDTTAWISCINCEADGPVRATVSEAKSAWNYRHPKE